MYSFEGDFRRKPIQSLGGASKKVERNLLLQQAQDERRKREELRLRQTSALKIQSFYRSAKTRAHKKNGERCQFDAVYQSVQKSSSHVSEATLLHLSSQLVFFYERSKDTDRLTWLSQSLLKHKDVFVNAICAGDGKQSKIYLFNRLLHLCCRHLEEVCQTTTPIAVPMRMLEVFTSLETYSQAANESLARHYIQTSLHYLVNRGYFKLMRTLVNAKVPSSLEKSSQPPTPLADSILRLLMNPLKFLPSATDDRYRKDTLQQLCKELLCPAYTEQISQFLLPAMVHGAVCSFPFIDMIHALLPATEDTTMDGSAIYNDSSELSIEPSPWLLYAVLNLSAAHLENLSAGNIVRYLRVLQTLVPQLNLNIKNEDDDMSDSDDEDADAIAMDTRTGGLSGLTEVREECIRLLDSTDHVKGIVLTVSRNPDTATLTAVCTVCYALMSSNRLSVLRMRFLYSLAFNPTLLRNLWRACVTVSTMAVTGVQTPLIHMLSRGLTISESDLDTLVPLVAVFCSLFSYSLISLHDSEFYGQEMDPILGTTRAHVGTSMPFTLAELVPMSQMLRDVCLGIIELAHPDSRPALQEDYRKAFRSVGVKDRVYGNDSLQKQRHTWAYLFKTVSQLVRQLHARDTRHTFCPPDHWLAWRVNIQADKPSQIYRAENPVFVRRPFGALSNLKKKEFDEEGPPLSNTEVKNLTILTELPFAVSFQERVKILQKLIHADRLENQGEMYRYLQGSTINIMVRRNYLYEDAFEKLSPDNEPNLKLRMQVQLINFAGLDEAGIDGGGLFREFLYELLKTGFDPNRGFFRNTQDRLLYPNPQAKVIMDSYTQHYYFLGRMLGKLGREDSMHKLSFASFRRDVNGDPITI